MQSVFFRLPLDVSKGQISPLGCFKMQKIKLTKEGQEAANAYLNAIAKRDKKATKVNAEIARLNEHNDIVSELQNKLLAIAGHPVEKPTLESFGDEKSQEFSTMLMRGNDTGMLIISKYSKRVPTEVPAPSVVQTSFHVGSAKLVKKIVNVPALVK